MKKFLLTIAILGSALCANAEDNLREFSDCFTVTYNGQELKDGDEVVCTNYEDTSDLYGPGTLMYNCKLKVENEDLLPTYMHAVLSYGTPSYKEWNAAPYEWGDATICSIPGSCYDSPDLKLYRGVGTPLIPAAGTGEFYWDLHLNAVMSGLESRYPLTLNAYSGDDAAATPISKSIKIYINYRMTPDSGVDEIEAAEGEGVWYDLQGRRVDNPSKGLYIYKTAGKAVKRIVK